MTFYAQELDGVCPAYGWMAGPADDTLVVTLRNRNELRQARGDLSRRTFVLPFQNITHADYLTYLLNAHMAMRGRLHTFLVKDWLDFEAEAESLGTAPAGSNAVQLKKTYSFGLATREREITKPLSSVVVYEDTGSSGPVAKAGTLDTLTGIFTPTDPWAVGAEVTWTGEFRVWVRFNNDYMPMTIDNASAGKHVVNGSVELIEVFN